MKELVMGYTVILQREPDGGYVAIVPILPGCVSQGDTREEAEANIREAIEVYLEDCFAAGDPIPTEQGCESGFYREAVVPHSPGLRSYPGKAKSTTVITPTGCV